MENNQNIENKELNNVTNIEEYMPQRRLAHEQKKKWYEKKPSVQAAAVSQKYSQLSRFGKMVCIGAAVVVVFLIGGLIHQSLSYKNFDVISSIEKTDNVSVSYQIVGEGLLRYSKDGVSYSESLDEMIWNQSFEMASARVVTCGDYMAIGDIGSNQVRIFNEFGQVGSLTTTHPIVDLAVASQGVVAVALSEGESNYIKMYDVEGTELVSIKTSIGQMGYPLDFALSPDGLKLVVNYLTILDGLLQTKMVFYHFGDAGNNEIDHIMGTFMYDAVYPKIEFVDESTVATYGETGFSLYSMTYYPEVLTEVDFGQEIKSLFVSDKYLGFIFRNNMEVAEGEKEPDGLYHMEVYTTAGRLYMEQDFDFEYESVACNNMEIIMYNDSECVTYTFGGKEKFTYTFDEPIIKLLPKNKADEYILIGSSSIAEIRLR